MIVLPDTTTYDSSIRLVQLVGGVTKVNMLKVCDKLDLYVSPNLKKDETARRVQKLYLVATYCDEEKQEWHMLMPDELRESLSSNYKFYLDLAEKGQKGPTVKQLRMMAAMKRIMGE